MTTALLYQADLDVKRSLSSCAHQNLLHHFWVRPPCRTCHGISPGITTSPPTMRLWGLGASDVGSSLSSSLHRGNLFKGFPPGGSSVTGVDAVVLAAVVGADVGGVEVVETLEALGCGVEFTSPSRDRVKAPTGVRAVLPQGNSAGGGRKHWSEYVRFDWIYCLWTFLFVTFKQTLSELQHNGDPGWRSWV